MEAGKLVAKSVESCVDASQAATEDQQLLKQVGVAATAVTQALNDLLEHIKQHATGGQPVGRYDQATDTILNVTENIFSSMGDAGEPRPCWAWGETSHCGSWGGGPLAPAGHPHTGTHRGLPSTKPGQRLSRGSLREGPLLPLPRPSRDSALQPQHSLARGRRLSGRRPRAAARGGLFVVARSRSSTAARVMPSCEHTGPLLRRGGGDSSAQEENGPVGGGRGRWRLQKQAQVCCLVGHSVKLIGNRSGGGGKRK